MAGGAGRGAAFGLVVGAGLVGVLVVLPAAWTGDSYELADALVALGVPLMLIGVAAGALLGAWRDSGTPQGSSVVKSLALAVCVVVLLLLSSCTDLFGMAARGVPAAGDPPVAAGG